MTSALGVDGRRILVVTGAGVSAESGIPTFRGPDGYWRKLNPRKLATAEAFRADPNLVWEWYEERRRLIRAAHPNAAHRAIATLADRAAGFLLLTQNVDDLHERAGTPSESIVKIHGDIFVNRCDSCGYQDRKDVSPAPVPTCPKCAGVLRPGVVWFDEELHPADVGRVEAFLAQGACDFVLVVGTTASFPYIRDWSLRGAGSTGLVIEVNPCDTELTPRVHRIVRAPAATVIPALIM
ncbi:MAG: NAD-dependent protein deacylase [Planctomycetes bacterium]|nr:NAD-dependent protein deacylase [Planctomycetota bacterium]